MMRWILAVDGKMAFMLKGDYRPPMMFRESQTTMDIMLGAYFDPYATEKVMRWARNDDELNVMDVQLKCMNPLGKIVTTITLKDASVDYEKDITSNKNGEMVRFIVGWNGTSVTMEPDMSAEDVTDVFGSGLVSVTEVEL